MALNFILLYGVSHFAVSHGTFLHERKEREICYVTFNLVIFNNAICFVLNVKYPNFAISFIL